MMEMGSENKNQVTLSIMLKILSVFQKWHTSPQRCLVLKVLMSLRMKPGDRWKQCIGAPAALLLRHLVDASELFPIEQS